MPIVKSTMTFVAVCAATLAVAAPASYFVECETFTDYGGWVVDPHSMKRMGSSYLMAHGYGVPVKDATRIVNFAEAGRYTVWARTRELEAYRPKKRHTLWFPSYGPEQRGGSASCSVVVSGTPIGSPTVEHPDVLVCMNQPSYERFVGDVQRGGIVIVDSTVPITRQPPEGVQLHQVPAIAMAEEFGVPKAANTMMLAALCAFNATGLKHENLEEALCASFKKKPQLIEKNRELLHRAEAVLSNS